MSSNASEQNESGTPAPPPGDRAPSSIRRKLLDLIWMEPRDLHMLQMSPTINSKAGQGISSRHAGGAHVLIADGAVRFLSENLPAETIRALLTIKGGEAISEF